MCNSPDKFPSLTSQGDPISCKKLEKFLATPSSTIRAKFFVFVDLLK